MPRRTKSKRDIAQQRQRIMDSINELAMDRQGYLNGRGPEEERLYRRRIKTMGIASRYQQNILDYALENNGYVYLDEQFPQSVYMGQQASGNGTAARGGVTK